MLSLISSSPKCVNINKISGFSDNPLFTKLRRTRKKIKCSFDLLMPFRKDVIFFKLYYYFKKILNLDWAPYLGITLTSLDYNPSVSIYHSETKNTLKYFLFVILICVLKINY